jgi:hypothetical protein
LNRYGLDVRKAAPGETVDASRKARERDATGGYAREPLEPRPSCRPRPP